MTEASLTIPQTFNTEAGSVTITGVDLEGPVERCVKGYLRDSKDERVTYPLEYDLNGRTRGRAGLDLDLRIAEQAKLMQFLDEERRRFLVGDRA